MDPKGTHVKQGGSNKIHEENDYNTKNNPQKKYLIDQNLLPFSERSTLYRYELIDYSNMITKMNMTIDKIKSFGKLIHLSC